MNIGFDAKRAFKNFTGLGNYSRFVVKSLSDHYPKNEYFLYSPMGTIKNEEVTDSCTNNNQKIITPEGLWNFPIMSGLWRSVYSGKTHNNNKLDIYHGLSSEIPVQKDKKTRYVVTIHDLIYLRFPHLYHPLDVKIYKYKAKFACDKADKIIAVSNQTAKDIIRFLNIPEKKIEVIHQGCHQNFKEEIKKEDLARVSKKYNLPPNYMLTVGTIEKRKNVGLILDFLNNNPDYAYPLVVVGKPSPYLKELKSYIEASGLEDRVLFLHQVSFEDLPSIYAGAYVFIYPSMFEGFGIPIIEAQESGVPVITSMGTCFEEVGGRSVLYTDPNDIDHLKSNLAALKCNGFRNSLIKKGKENTQRFQPDAISKKLIDVYDNLV
jgi:glycosyltransferase involved in cell wall biosynthesis